MLACVVHSGIASSRQLSQSDTLDPIVRVKIKAAMPSKSAMRSAAFFYFVKAVPN
jgi:hypothetical protein